MKRFLVISLIVVLHLLAFEGIIRFLGLRDFGYRVTGREILLLLAVPFAIPTIPALLETRVVTLALGAEKFERLEKGVYPVDIIAGLAGVMLGAAVLMLVKNATILWPVLAVVIALVVLVSGWAKYDILKKKLNGSAAGLGKSLGLAVFGGNMLAHVLFIGAWLLLITQKLLS